MDGQGIDRPRHPTADATGRRGRRDAARSFGALGVALLATLGRSDGLAARKRRRKKCSCPSGIATRKVVGTASNGLAVTAGTFVNAFANCGGTAKPVSCGYVVNGQAGQLVNALVTFASPTNDELQCGVNLFRTAEAGASAGATIQAVAICPA